MDVSSRLKKIIAQFRIFRLHQNGTRFAMRKFLYLPRVISGLEKRYLLFLVIIVFLSGIGLITRLYLQFTVPVPNVAGSYTEGVIGEPRAINPLYASRDTDRDISRLIFSGLLTYNESSIIEPDLAQRVEISDDGKIYTIVLKNNLIWHDGEPITADDIVFTIHTIQNSQYRSPLRSNWQGVNVEKLNDQSVRFILRAPYTPFIENLTIGIIPKHIWQNVSPEQAPLHEVNLKPVGSGPYRFDAMKQNKDGSLSWYQVVRNPNYHREGPFIKTIIFQFYKNEDDMFTAWRKGAIDGYGGISPLHLSNVNPDKSLVLSLSMPRIFGIFFNPKRATQLEDIQVRQAIAAAINRDEIVKDQRQNQAVPKEVPLPWLGSTNTPEVYPHNVGHARTLLAQAGWKDENNDGVLEKSNKKKNVRTKPVTTELRFTLITSDWPDLIKTAQHIQQQLKEVGIEVIIDKKPFSELESSIIRPRNFEMLLFGQVYGYEPDPFAFWHSSQVKDPGLNITFFSDKKVDKLLEDMRKTSDPKIRDKNYRDFSDILTKNLPAIFLFSQDYLYLLPTRIQGVSPIKISLPSDRFNEIHKWYRSTKRVFKWGD